ncbi:MAG TPA: SDR family oxidoreductase [Planctomycetes bacterium]|nr:SDR family oxidoreductase [Planctomycetota bacterium]
MDLNLKERIAWVTGASGGIGRAIASELGSEGVHLALQAHSNASELRSWVSEQPFGAKALVLEADVRSPEELDRCAERILEAFGRIDICIPCAGIWPTEDLSLDEMPPERLANTLAVNLAGALFTARSFLGALRRTGPHPDGEGASIAFIGSTAARFGERDHADYAASKAGLVGAMRSLKNEIVRLDPFGRVNVLEPGWTVTHMARPALQEPGVVERVVRTMALRQLARATDIARVVAVLASPYASSHVTGQVVTVAGGMEGRLLWGEQEIDRPGILARLER